MKFYKYLVMMILILLMIDQFSRNLHKAQRVLLTILKYSDLILTDCFKHNYHKMLKYL